MAKLYTTQEVADMLGVSRQTVYNWIENNEIESVKLVGRIRITQEAIDKLIKGK